VPGTVPVGATPTGSTKEVLAAEVNAEPASDRVTVG
jgi:hypothetical protein